LLSASDVAEIDGELTPAEAVEEPHGDDEPEAVSPTGVGELPL
jgi:hypothetical protein